MFSPISHVKTTGRIRGVFAALSFGFAAFIPSTTAYADTPAQVQAAIQAVCDRAVAGYSRRDLPSVLAMYTPSYVLTNVTGRKYNYRWHQANVATLFARDDYHVVSRCTVSQVIPLGIQARVLLRWQFTDHHARSASAPAYIYLRNYEEHSVWKKLPSGWHQISGQMIHDVVEYRR